MTVPDLEATPARRAPRHRARTWLAVTGLVVAGLAGTAVVAATNGGGTSGGGTSGPPAATAPTAAAAPGDPSPCPSAAPGRAAPPTATGALGPAVTGRPTEARLCRYSPLSPTSRLTGQRLVTDPGTVGRLGALLDALAPFPQGVANCPLDDGSAIVLRFNSGENLTAWLTGCPRLVAPSGVYRLTAGAQRDLTALLPAG